jgi:cysteine-rich repeat protein
MRTHLLAVLALTIPACAGEISNTGGGDDTGGAVCGNGTVEAGEQCDDGNAVAGDGCSATCQTEQVVTPRVTLTVDKPTITSDLGLDNAIVVTATSEMGYAGTITLAAAAADSSNTAITDWTSTLDQTSLTLTAGGTATAHLTLSALGDAAMLGGTVTLTATGPATPAKATVGVTFNPILDVTFAESTTTPGKCDYPAGHSVNNPFQIKSGRTIKVFNGATTLGLQVHTNSGIATFPHEQTVTAPGTAYTQTVTYAEGAD